METASQAGGSVSGEIVRIGMIMCNRYHTCAAGKCLRALRNREGAFSIYVGKEVEIVGCTTCGGCPGGNVEYAPAEMKKNGATVIHLATGMLVGYPPCARIDYFRRFIQEQYGISVVVGTHPIPQKYFKVHQSLGSWTSPMWQELIQPTLATENIRLAYD
jgi:predicted metal-binding protein